VVGVAVGVEAIDEFEPKVLAERRVALGSLDDWVDQQCLQPAATPSHLLFTEVDCAVTPAIGGGPAESRTSLVSASASKYV
jgi:hypothetical protein